MAIFKAFQGQITKRRTKVMEMKYLSSSPPPHFKQSSLYKNVFLKCLFLFLVFPLNWTFFSDAYMITKVFLWCTHLASLFSLKKKTNPKSWNNVYNLCNTLLLSWCIIQVIVIKNSELTHSFRKKHSVCVAIPCFPVYTCTQLNVLQIDNSLI